MQHPSQHQETHPDRENAAVDLILEGHSDATVAKQLNVSRTTVWRWRNKPKTVALIAAKRNRQREASEARLAELVAVAMDCLESVLTDAQASPAVRLKAATEILDRAGMTANAAATVTDTGIKAERNMCRRLDELDDPNSFASLQVAMGLG